MTLEEELEWHRSWRNRLLHAMNWWRKPGSYEDGCKAWTAVSKVLREPPPEEHNPDRNRE